MAGDTNNDGADWRAPGVLLALETSGLRGSVALARVDSKGGAHEIESLELPASSRSAQSLAPAIQKLLEQNGLDPQQLSCVAVTVGPGSFTGLRVGVTTAKALAYAARAALVEVHTLAALAEPYLADASGPVWGVLDAQRGEFFTAQVRDAYGAPPETLRLDREALLSRLNAGATLVGPVAARIAEGAEQPFVAHVVEPSSASVARIGAARWRSNQLSDPFQLVPDYCRPSAAEENADAREAKG